MTKVSKLGKFTEHNLDHGDVVSRTATTKKEKTLEYEKIMTSKEKTKTLPPVLSGPFKFQISQSSVDERYPAFAKLRKRKGFKPYPNITIECDPDNFDSDVGVIDG